MHGILHTLYIIYGYTVYTLTYVNGFVQANPTMEFIKQDDKRYKSQQTFVVKDVSWM